MLGGSRRPHRGAFTLFALTELASRRRWTRAPGYLLKDAQPEEITRAVRSAHEGGSPIDARVASNLLEERKAVDPDVLTPREREVLILVGQGMLNKQVARERGFPRRRSRLTSGASFNRLGVTDRTQAAVWAQRNGCLLDQ